MHLLKIATLCLDWFAWLTDRRRQQARLSLQCFIKPWRAACTLQKNSVWGLGLTVQWHNAKWWEWVSCVHNETLMEDCNGERDAVHSVKSLLCADVWWLDWQWNSSQFMGHLWDSCTNEVYYIGIGILNAMVYKMRTYIHTNLWRLEHQDYLPHIQLGNKWSHHQVLYIRAASLELQGLITHIEYSETCLGSMYTVAPAAFLTWSIEVQETGCSLICITCVGKAVIDTIMDWLEVEELQLDDLLDRIEKDFSQCSVHQVPITDHHSILVEVHSECISWVSNETTDVESSSSVEVETNWVGSYCRVGWPLFRRWNQIRYHSETCH